MCQLGRKGKRGERGALWQRPQGESTGGRCPTCCRVPPVHSARAREATLTLSHHLCRAAGFRDIQLHCGDVLCRREPELSPGSCPEVLLACVPHGVCGPTQPPGLAWPGLPAAAGTRGGQAGPGSGPGRLPQPGGSEGEQGTHAALPLTADTAGCASHCRGLSVGGGGRGCSKREGREAQEQEYGAAVAQGRAEWMKAGQALAAGVPALPCPGGQQGGDCKRQPIGPWFTQWSTAGLHPVQPLPALNSNIVSVLQLPQAQVPFFMAGPFPGVKHQQHPGESEGCTYFSPSQANRSRCHSSKGRTKLVPLPRYPGERTWPSVQ